MTGEEGINEGGSGCPGVTDPEPMRAFSLFEMYLPDTAGAPDWGFGALMGGR